MAVPEGPTKPGVDKELKGNKHGGGKGLIAITFHAPQVWKGVYFSTDTRGVCTPLSVYIGRY